MGQSFGSGSPVLPNNVPRINSGHYAGTGVANKAVAHGLGKIPLLIIIEEDTSNTDQFIITNTNGGSNPISAWEHKQSSTYHAQWGYGITPPDSTNFYVGDTLAKANDGSKSYYWVAIG